MEDPAIESEGNSHRGWRRIADVLPRLSLLSKRTLDGHPEWWRRWLFAVGIFVPGKRPWQVEFSPRFFAVIGIGIMVTTIVLGGAVFYSESPSFCRSCHIMEPYYDAWKRSKHNGIACVECHYPPATSRTLLWKKFQALSQVAKYVTRTYSSKPFAEVENASCLRPGCHSTRLLQGKVVTTLGIKFDHRPHLMEVRRGRQLRCVSCHSQVVVGRHIEVTYDTCYLCHFKGRGKGRNLNSIGGCLGCHNLPAKTFQIGNMQYRHQDFVSKQGIACQNCHMDSVAGTGDVPKDRCLTCHNQPEKVARYSDIAFVHDNHVTRHNIACFHCHDVIRHGFETETANTIASTIANLHGPGVVPVSSMPSNRHPPTLTFACSLCHANSHTGQLEMYSGEVASLGLPEMPSPMYEAHVNCVGCHYRDNQDGSDGEFRGTTYRASDGACVKCHGATFNGVWQGIRMELEKTLAKMGAKLDAAKAVPAKPDLPGDLRQRLSSDLGQAEHWYQFVRSARGEHNIYLASETLRRVDRLISAVGKKAGVSLPRTSSLPLISGSYCATLCHRKVGVKVPPVTVHAFGKIMPHGDHADMMGCVECHAIGAHKKVPLIKDIQSKCKGCHPKFGSP